MPDHREHFQIEEHQQQIGQGHPVRIGDFPDQVPHRDCRADPDDEQTEQFGELHGSLEPRLQHLLQRIFVFHG
ncbi:hypothetical protein [Burkholderia gladioli]|uniref:hypothetical protein n=1 Tax=Burkholderia gladioli TaxID=28095 RepID=UPI0020B4380B|nr:hypothetical protein [Burkholderia gladioli]